MAMAWKELCSRYVSSLQLWNRGLAASTRVSQVSDTRIVIAVDPPETGGEDPDLPDRCRVVKLASSVTYDR